jgi:hypothetical protein
MAQRVITEATRLQAVPIPQPYELRKDSELAKALADGWTITHLSTVIDNNMHYITAVIEKHEASNLEQG